MNNLYVSSGMKNIYNNTKLKMNESSKKCKVDDMCPICLDDLDNGEELEYCKYSCGKAIHKMCFQMWFHKNSIKCLFCGANFNKTYINLINT